MKSMKSLSVVGVVLVGLLVATGASAGVRHDAIGSGAYGYYGGYQNYGCGSSSSSCGAANYPQPVQQPCMQYPQPTQQYCMQWVQGRWVPVRVMVPGRWEHRPVWIPGYPMTLYRPSPGYWQQTVRPGQPDLSVWQTPNGWNGAPSQGQANDGYFDNAGVWHPYR